MGLAGRCWGPEGRWGSDGAALGSVGWRWVPWGGVGVWRAAGCGGVVWGRWEAGGWAAAVTRRWRAAEREAAGTNPDQARQEPGDGAEREAARAEIRAHLRDGRQPRQALRHGGEAPSAPRLAPQRLPHGRSPQAKSHNPTALGRALPAQIPTALAWSSALTHIPQPHGDPLQPKYLHPTGCAPAPQLRAAPVPQALLWPWVWWGPFLVSNAPRLLPRWRWTGRSSKEPAPTRRWPRPTPRWQRWRSSSPTPLWPSSRTRRREPRCRPGGGPSLP